MKLHTFLYYSETIQLIKYRVSEFAQRSFIGLCLACSDLIKVGFYEGSYDDLKIIIVTGDVLVTKSYLKHNDYYIANAQSL